MTQTQQKPGAGKALFDNHEQLVRENIGWMLVLAERILNDHVLAQDTVQEAFIFAIRGLAKFEGRSSLKTWLHRITVNAALTKLRQTKGRLEEPVENLCPEFDQNDCRVEAQWSELTPLEDMLKNEHLKLKVRETFGALPDSYRIVLLLRDIEGYNTVETSKLLDISEANVKVLLHRARATLKLKLEPVLRNG